MPELHAELDHRVTPTELFFDLVFVFAFTQVTTLLVDDPTWGGFGRGLLVVAVLWWAWASYAWLTNTVDADDGIVLAVMLAATAAMFVAALAVPEAFGSHRLVFALAFLVVLVMFVGLFAVAGRAEPDLLAAVLRMARTTLLGGALIVAAAFVRQPSETLTVAGGCRGGFCWADPGWRARLACPHRALRRAARPDSDHRARRGARRDRAGRQEHSAWR